MGNLVIKLPLPPGCSSEIWNNKNRFYEAYLKNLMVIMIPLMQG